MNFIYEILGTPLGWIIWLIYQVIHNYGLAIIIFTLLLKLVLLPVAIKQQKSSAKMGALQPKMAEINKKYAKNPQKRQEELMKLQQEFGYSPMKGCLPTLIQFAILFGIIDVVYKPLTHILRLSKDTIAQLTDIAGNISGTMASQQMSIISAVHSDPDKFSAVGADVIDKIQGLDLNFFGLNLGDTPSLVWPIILIPILACVFSFLQMFISMKMNPMGADGGNPAMGGSMKVMMVIMPLMSLWITFSVPVGVGIYWMFTYIIGIAQVILLNKLYNPKKLREEAIAEMEEKRKSSKKSVVKKEVIVDGEKVIEEKVLSQKELDRQRLAAARKRDAEKYDDEVYEEVTDEDLN